MLDHATERIEAFRPENEPREEFVPYIDDVPDGPIIIGSPFISMPTALAYIFSDEGFVVAADGFNTVREQDGPRVNSKIAQKVFQLPGTNRHVACSFFGMVTLFNDARETIFNFVSECIEAAKAVESVPVRDANELAAQICPLIQKRLSAVKQSGELTRYPSLERRLGEIGYTILRINLDGYFDGQPFRTGIRFYHVDQELAWGQSPHDLSPWSKSCLMGSDTVGGYLFDTEDPRLSKYRTDSCRTVAGRFRKPDTAVTLQDAIEAARSFIAACSDPVALEIEGVTFQRIGGHILIATITPRDGFRWVPGCEPIPPGDVLPHNAPIR